MSASMDAEASSFETSETLATLLASTPLVTESWRVCTEANRASTRSFVTEKIGEIDFVSFSGIQIVDFSDNGGGNLVPLDGEISSLFSPLISRNEDEEPAMVHPGLLNLFLSVYNFQKLHEQMLSIIEKSKSIIITGHSIGGAIASLCTLWLLSSLQSKSHPHSILCITFGSPLIGNQSLSKAILRERWGGKFCHVVSKHDIMPRLLFAPLPSFTPHLNILQRFWHLSMTSPQHGKLATQLTDEQKCEIFNYVFVSLEMAGKCKDGSEGNLFCPFGSFLFCCEVGGICVDNASSVVRMLYLMFKTGSPSDSFEDHLKYGDYVGEVSSQFLKKRNFMEEEDLSNSSYDASMAFALESLGIASQESIASEAKDCLKTARRMGLRPNINLAKLAITLSKITPYRAEIEWYKATCDEADDQLGYYDSFKQRGASKRGFKVNMNRHKLARFWAEVIHMLDNNILPPDFHQLAKWVNASQFYKLLVEPLDIAEYYRRGMHRVKGHYLKNGRERRYEIFDKWWRERDVTEEDNKKRSSFASLTQDTCFWARVEEARDWLSSIKFERFDGRKLDLEWENIEKFEKYALRLIQNKEVSKDVLAKNSSYSLWVEELREIRLQRQKLKFQPQISEFMD